MDRKSYWSQVIQGHVRNEKWLYIFVSVLFMMGLVFGAIIVNALEPSQKDGLTKYLGYFFHGLSQESIAEPSVVFTHSIGDHLKTVGFMWILGLSVVGVPILVLYVFFKGLVIGFTVGFLVSQLSWKGFWFALVSVVPQNLLIIPALIIITVTGIRFAIHIVQNRLIQHRGTIYPEFVSYSLLVATMVFFLLGATLIEAYVSPLLMKNMIPTL